MGHASPAQWMKTCPAAHALPVLLMCCTAGLCPCREINRGGLLLIYQILADTAQADIAKALQVSGDRA